MKQIAVVGAGLAGLGLAWHLLQHSDVSVTLFDPLGPGGGASGISTGLLHPFPAKQSLRSWRASEGMEATRQLLHVAEQALGRPVAEQTGLLRLMQRKRAEEDPEAIWWEPKQVQELIPDAAALPGLWIPSGITVYSKLYLQGLWKACQSRGARFEKRSVHSLNELASYDRVVLATGYETLRFPECAHLPLEPVKGQALLCRWPKRLPCSLVSLGHITPTEDPAFCQIGSTYEHEFRDLEPTQSAVEELKKKVGSWYPPAKEFEVVRINAGVRMSPQEGYRPMVLRLNEKSWTFTGLGSRGLLYHALLGKELAFGIIRTL